MYEVKIEAYNAKLEKQVKTLLVQQPTFGGAEEKAVSFVTDLWLTDPCVKTIKRSPLIVGDFNPELPAFILTIEFDNPDGKPFKEQHLVSATTIDEASSLSMDGEIKKIVQSKIEEVI